MLGCSFWLRDFGSTSSAPACLDTFVIWKSEDNLYPVLMFLVISFINLDTNYLSSDKRLHSSWEIVKQEWKVVTGKPEESTGRYFSCLVVLIHGLALDDPSVDNFKRMHCFGRQNLNEMKDQTGRNFWQKKVLSIHEKIYFDPFIVRNFKTRNTYLTRDRPNLMKVVRPL